jgi:uncharacterized protein (DUF4415 family)
MKKVNSDQQRAELAVLAKMPDEQINVSAIPEQRDWRGARRGLFYRPVKQQLTLRLDADIIAWFKSRAREGEGYQTSINAALRAHVAKHPEDR